MTAGLSQDVTAVGTCTNCPQHVPTMPHAATSSVCLVPPGGPEAPRAETLPPPPHTQPPLSWGQGQGSVNTLGLRGLNVQFQKEPGH